MMWLTSSCHPALSGESWCIAYAEGARPFACVGDPSMELFEFVECSNRLRSLPDLFSLLVAAADKEGFDQVAYGALNYREPLHLADHQAPAVAINFPRDWQSHYFEHNYHHIDPVVTLTPSIARPFLWSRLQQQHAIRPEQRLIFEEARVAGLNNGISIPLHGAWGRCAVLSFASRAVDSEPDAKLNRLNVLASQFHVAFTDMSPSRQPPDMPVQLSQREKDCLLWTAQGKSSWDIGMILNISGNTVNFHLKNAMRKLDTTSRTVAVVKAIRRNLIQIP
jgi:LuxR family quorum-sensing system transcriptional regulator CciR